MQEPYMDKAMNLLGYLGEARGQARACIETQLDLLPVRAALLDRDGVPVFRNRRQRDIDIPDFSLRGADSVEILHEGGEAVVYRVAAKREAEGAPEGYLIAGSEIEHELAKMPLKKALSDKIQLSELVDKSPVITLMLIPNKRMDVIFASGNIEKLGYRRDKFYLSRLSWLDVVHPDDREKFTDEINRLIRICVRFSYKYRVLTASGVVLHVQSDMTVMRDESGRPMYFEGTVTDISDQIELERAITESTDQYDSRLQAILNPEPDAEADAKLLELLSMEVIDRQFGRMAEEYGLCFMLSGSDSENIGAWTPGRVSGEEALAECAGHINLSLMNVAKTVLSGGGYQTLNHNGKIIGMAGIYIARHLAAYCCFCKKEEVPADEFEPLCELVSIVCETLSEDCTQSIELMRQVDKTHMIREATDRDFKEQILVNLLITKLYDSGSTGEVLSDMIALVGEHLGVSRVYLYEPAAGGLFDVTHEWTQGDLLSLPLQARHFPAGDLLSDKGEGVRMLSDPQHPFVALSGALQALHCPIYYGGRLCGVLGIAECISDRDWRRDFVSSVFKVVSEAVLWKNSRRSAAQMFSSLSSMLENINALVYVADCHSQKVLFANSKLLKAVEGDPEYAGKRERDEPGTTPADFFGGIVSKRQARGSGEHMLAGRWYKETVSLIDWMDGRKARLVCLFDIHDIKEQELRIEYTAYHDPLLGIYNRRRFEQDLEQAMKQAQQQSGAIILLDLDDFKYINDAYGHDKGDETLRRFVATVKPIIGESFYRCGGDEFMALLRGIESARLKELVNEIVHTLQAASPNYEEELACTASIGVARYPQDGHIAGDLLRSVDMAMYQAKQEGKGSAVFFTPNLEASGHRRHNLDKLLKSEVEAGCPNMALVYQPMLRTATGELFGVEALLRWHHPEAGTIMPDEFVGMAEMLGLMHTIGDHVLDRAVSDAVRLRKIGPDIVVSVNMFMRQLQSAALADTVLALLAKHRCPAGALMLEMTERMTLYDHQRRYGQLAKLRAAGVLICADDFGSGQSSTAHLRDRLWNLVKIDCKGIRDIHVDPYMRTFVKTRVQIAHAAGVEVCAEGVENDEQRALLAAFECDYIQGYLMDRPVALEKVIEKYGKK